MIQSQQRPARCSPQAKSTNSQNFSWGAIHRRGLESQVGNFVGQYLDRLEYLPIIIRLETDTCVDNEVNQLTLNRVEPWCLDESRRNTRSRVTLRVFTISIGCIGAIANFLH